MHNSRGLYFEALVSASKLDAPRTPWALQAEARGPGRVRLITRYRRQYIVRGASPVILAHARSWSAER